jgi:hypothetical protein
MDSNTGPADGKRNSLPTAETKESITSSALLGHLRYTVAFPTLARAATDSMVSSLNPTRSSNAKVLRMTALRAFSLRGRPGLREEVLATGGRRGMCHPTLSKINPIRTVSHLSTSILFSPTAVAEAAVAGLPQVNRGHSRCGLSH